MRAVKIHVCGEPWDQMTPGTLLESLELGGNNIRTFAIYECAPIHVEVFPQSIAIYLTLGYDKIQEHYFVSYVVINNDAEGDFDSNFGDPGDDSDKAKEIYQSTLSEIRSKGVLK